ncbi:FAD-dependent oxidoreductase [Sulfolobus acidocaldarius SUSAZ]|nr:FAD-dependent oxidoreductase [Sulfolobus acidocaldarius SUSAZ]
MNVSIIGGGPAGLSLAWFLRGTKYNATVYEGLDNVGYKPCAWGLITGVEELVPISKEAIIGEIKRFRIYLNGKIVHDIESKKRLGYIIDKPLFLRDIAEKVNVQYNSKVTERKGEYLVNGNQKLESDMVINSTGHYSLSFDQTIPAIQYITDYKIDSDIVEFYFYSDLLGYAWVFPDRYGSKIGIGGWASVDFLRQRLSSVIKGKTLFFHGARVADIGILDDRLNGKYVGEAIGAVYPLTGEGIRPSILSSKMLADSLLKGKEFKAEFKSSKLYFTIQSQAKIIEGVKKKVIGTDVLSKMLTKTDPDLVLKIAIGDFGKLDLIKIFGRSLLP